MTLNTTEKSTN